MSKKQNAPYSDKYRHETLRRCDQEGVTAIQIAKELGIGVNQIYNLA
ncbi:MAG: transposase [Candidatus Azotimanducaceae bacterium]|jgi:transposase